MLHYLKNQIFINQLNRHIKIYSAFQMDKALVKLSRTGDTMPLMGFGTWKVSKETCPQTVYQTLKAGYRLLDCACDYGNEEEVGKGIKKALDEKVLERKDLFVTSKLWNTFHRAEHVRPACLRTLKDLGLEYLDLYLIHFPISLKYVDPEVRYPPEWFFDPNAEKPCMVEDPVPILQTWRAMEALVEEGLVRNIGISNFNVALIRDLLYSCKIKPAVLQIEVHPYNTQKRLIRFCQEKDIQLTSYSTMGASSYMQLGFDYKEEVLTQDKCIVELAEKYKKTAAQIILRWAVQQSIAIIPKTSKAERLIQNSSLFDWEISEEDMTKIDNLNRNRRYNDPAFFCEVAFNTFFPIYD